MKRFMILGLVVASFFVTNRAYAQEGPAGAGRAEITFIPGGAVLFAESKDVSAPSFGNYQVGGAVTYNINRFVGIEGEVNSSIGISQSLDFGYPSTVRTPDVLSYTGNVVLAVPSGTSVVPYVTGGVGGLSLFSREAFGINKTETLFATNVGAGLKWYAGRWGLRGDYRFIAVPSRDETSAFFGTEPRYGHRVYGAVMLNVAR
jgi:outer membrane protein with beta-barrel domain